MWAYTPSNCERQVYTHVALSLAMGEALSGWVSSGLSPPSHSTADTAWRGEWRAAAGSVCGEATHARGDRGRRPNDKQSTPTTCKLPSSPLVSSPLVYGLLSHFCILQSPALMGKCSRESVGCSATSAYRSLQHECGESMFPYCTTIAPFVSSPLVPSLHHSPPLGRSAASAADAVAVEPSRAPTRRTSRLRELLKPHLLAATAAVAPLQAARRPTSIGTHTHQPQLVHSSSLPTTRILLGSDHRPYSKAAGAGNRPRRLGSS